jgi:hypothetical protein
MSLIHIGQRVAGIMNGWQTVSLLLSCLFGGSLIEFGGKSISYGAHLFLTAGAIIIRDDREI